MNQTLESGMKGFDVYQFDNTELKNKFTSFLQDSVYREVYTVRMLNLVETGGNRLIVDLDHLRQFDHIITAHLLRNPVPCILAFEKAFEDSFILIRDEYNTANFNESRFAFKVGFVGNFGAHQVSPRSLNSNFLGHLISLEGIVTKISIVRPKIVKSVHYSEEVNKTISKNYRDWTNLDGLPTSTNRPRVDSQGNDLILDYGNSIYKNSQVITIQEMPESSPLGQLPRSIDVLLDFDLVNSCKPGDRIITAGLYRAKLMGGGEEGLDGTTSQFFVAKLIANSLQKISKEMQINTTETDLHNIRELSQKKNIFSILSKSLAPSIFGHKYIKQALLLMLLGGIEKNVSNGTHLRGDINILMIGDPSTAKSQLLRFVLGTAPLAISATGRGSTGVGLTAAVTTDPDTKERRLEAGAMVLADRGVVCIDEFDKMSENDRVALHEVMEQQTVTISKAGIHSSLNARCSVVAAANPIYGNYDRDLTPQRNVNLPDSLLSRFDLLFIILDIASPSHDSKISEHILQLHRYERPGHEGKPFSLKSDLGFSSIALDNNEENEKDNHTSPVYQKFNSLLHGGYANEKGRRDELLHPVFLRKYIHYAKNRIKPKLTKEACNFINSEYTRLRNRNNESEGINQNRFNNVLPITARQLESFIRLATAHAKARLSYEVEEQDAAAALKIICFAIDQQELPDNDSHHDNYRSNVNNDFENFNKEDNADSFTQIERKTSKKKRQSFYGLNESSSDDDADKNIENLMMNHIQSYNGKKNKHDINNLYQKEEFSETSSEFENQSERFTLLSKTLKNLFHRNRKESLLIDELIDELHSEVSKLKTKKFTRKEIDSYLTKLELNNKIMYRGGEILKIF